VLHIDAVTCTDSEDFDEVEIEKQPRLLQIQAILEISRHHHGLRARRSVFAYTIIDI